MYKVKDEVHQAWRKWRADALLKGDTLVNLLFATTPAVNDNKDVQSGQGE